MTNDPIPSVAPKSGVKIIDKEARLSDPQQRVCDPNIKGAPDMRKTGVKIVSKNHAD
jgi:hypothetical protein